MDIAGRLRSRLALPERAAEVAAALVERWDGQVPVMDTGAYAPSDEAVYRQRRDGGDRTPDPDRRLRRAHAGEDDVIPAQAGLRPPRVRL